MPKNLFQKGNPGKAKGTTNKLTRTVRELLLEVFNDLQDDPKANLLAWAISEPGEFYKIASKLIPTEVNSNLSGVIATEQRTVIKWGDKEIYV